MAEAGIARSGQVNAVWLRPSEARPRASGPGPIGSEEAPHFAMRKFTMEPNGGMPRHTNLVEHEQYVLNGSATVEIGGETFEVAAGDSVYIPGGLPHSYKAGSDGFEFLCVVPNQEDRIELV